MKFGLKDVAAATGLMLSLVGAISPAFATIILDQGNAALSPQTFGLSSELTWQQGVTAGQTGKLSNVDVFFLEAGSVEFSIYGSAPWSTSNTAFRSVVNVTSGWNSINVDSANFYVDVGKQFSIGLHGVGPPDTVGPSFGGSGVFGGNNNGAYAGGELWWQFQDQFGRGTNPQPLGAPIDPPIYDMGFRTYVDTGAPLPTPAVDAVAPTNVQLAQMSRDAYSEYSNQAVGSFQIVGSKGIEDDANTVFAQAYMSNGANGGRAQIVIAIRGSIALEDFELRNGTFSGSGATVEYQNGAIDVADFIGTLRAQYPNADFTLTGHSLGGAIAQSVAEQIGVNAVGFDAPGAKGLLTGISDNLKSRIGGQIFSSTQDLQTIRAYGDEFSKIGASYGGLYTDIRTVGLLPDGIANRAAIDAVGGLCAYLCHRMDSLYDALAAGQIYENGISDSVTSPNLPIAGAVALGNALKQFNLAVGARIFPLDPSGIGDLIEIQMLDSDVYVTGILLPEFDQLFPVWFYEGNQWRSLGQFQGYQEFSVPVSSAFRIGNADALKGETGAFALGLRFSSEGTFRGTIGLADSSVPEPQTWALFIVGFGFVGFGLRRGRNRTLLSHT